MRRSWLCVHILIEMRSKTRITTMWGNPYDCASVMRVVNVPRYTDSYSTTYTSINSSKLAVKSIYMQMCGVHTWGRDEWIQAKQRSYDRSTKLKVQVRVSVVYITCIGTDRVICYSSYIRSTANLRTLHAYMQIYLTAVAVLYESPSVPAIRVEWLSKWGQP